VSVITKSGDSEYSIVCIRFHTFVLRLTYYHAMISHGFNCSEDPKKGFFSTFGSTVGKIALYLTKPLGSYLMCTVPQENP
jgi:hypothetical protein